MATGNKMVNGTECKGRLKKPSTGQESEAFQEEKNPRNKKPKQSQNMVLKHTHQKPSLRIPARLAEKAFVVSPVWHKQSMCLREVAFLFFEEKYTTKGNVLLKVNMRPAESVGQRFGW